METVLPVIWFIRKQMRAHRQGLSLPQFRTLAAVDRSPSLSLSALADFLGSSLPTASRMVEGLVKKGHLARTGCPGDRRQLALAITPAGRAVLTAAWSHTQAEMERSLAGLTSADRTAVLDAMGIISEIFGTAGLPDAVVAPTRSNGKRTNGHSAETHPSRRSGAKG